MWGITTLLFSTGKNIDVNGGSKKNKYLLIRKNEHNIIRSTERESNKVRRLK